MAKINAVAMDMSPAYREAVSTHLPKATIVYDHFRVIKLCNDQLSNLRRWLDHQAEDEPKKVLKRVRWLLLKASEDLDAQHTASYLKEDLRQFWERPGKRFATALLNDWIRRAQASGIRILQQMAKTLESHRSGLLAYYDFPISTGPHEGTNNKIQILAIHETRYALVG